MPPQTVYLADRLRHLICYPYSIKNLHLMAADLQIKRCWFHKDHYDIPKRRITEILEDPRVTVVEPITILRVARYGETYPESD